MSVIGLEMLRSVSEEQAEENRKASAAHAAIKGRTGVVMAFERTGDYVCTVIENNVADVANKERKVPDEFISENSNDVTDAFMKYARPLILGDVQVITEDGVPKHITR